MDERFYLDAFVLGGYIQYADLSKDFSLGWTRWTPTNLNDELPQTLT